MQTSWILFSQTGSVLNIELILLVNCCHKQGLQSNDAKAGIFGRGPSTSTFMDLVIPCSECPPSYLCVHFMPWGFIRTEPYLQLDNPCCFIKLSWNLQVTEAQLTMSMSQWPKFNLKASQSLTGRWSLGRLLNRPQLPPVTSSTKWE